MKINQNLLCVSLLLLFMTMAMSSCWYQSGKSRTERPGEMKIYSEKEIKKHERQSARLDKLLLREEERRKAKRRK